MVENWHLSSQKVVEQVVIFNLSSPYLAFLEQTLGAGNDSLSQDFWQRAKLSLVINVQGRSNLPQLMLLDMYHLHV